jgi:predicted O-methyltransferase YrrM
MSEELWTAVDRYLVEHLVASEPVLDAALKANAEAGLPSIDVSPVQGKLLHLLARMRGAKRILEIGTLGGYSTIWLARVLPADGKLISLEFELKHVRVARSNIERAGLASRVEVRAGAALDSLAKLHAECAEPFDFIFIDADKENIPAYFECALRLARPGTAIVLDNVVRDGEIIDTHSADPRVQGCRRFFEMLSGDERVSATAIQTVGSKGHDGFALLVVNDPTSNDETV